jgi:hypothetical protein
LFAVEPPREGFELQDYGGEFEHGRASIVTPRRPLA